MLKAIKLNALFLITLFLYSNSLRISILPPVKNSFYKDILSSYDDLLSKQKEPKDKLYKLKKTCEKITSTYKLIGDESFANYQSCIPSYDLLGLRDPQLFEDQPLCYTSLANFFCENYIEFSEEKRKQKETTIEEITKFILNALGHCVNDNLDGDYSIVYRCPSLDKVSYLVKDPNLFCKGVQKIKLLETDKFQKFSLDDEAQQICQKVITGYNACINSENYVFVNTNYERCYDSDGSFYMNNKFGTFDNTEKEICLQFSLPVIASIYTHVGPSRDNEDICENFDNKVFNIYNNYKTKAMKTLEEAIYKEDSKDAEKIKFLNNYIKRLEDHEAFFMKYFGL